MPLLRRGDMEIVVPDEVVADYRNEGWAPPGEERSPDPDDSWTVDQLRKVAAERSITYKGLNKAQLLKALA